MLENLDRRDLMSVYAWTGAVSTDARDILNWATDAPPAPPMPGMPGGTMPPPLPGLYDELYFNAAANDSSGNSRNCERLAYANTSFAGMHIQAGYNGTVFLAGAILSSTALCFLPNASMASAFLPPLFVGAGILMVMTT